MTKSNRYSVSVSTNEPWNRCGISYVNCSPNSELITNDNGHKWMERIHNDIWVNYRIVRDIATTSHYGADKVRQVLDRKPVTFRPLAMTFGHSETNSHIWLIELTYDKSYDEYVAVIKSLSDADQHSLKYKPDEKFKVTNSFRFNLSTTVSEYDKNRLVWLKSILQ